jgi:hypothetical protein
MSASFAPQAPDVPFSEDDYGIAGGGTGFVTAGEYGPLKCGCYIVATPFDPCGPCLLTIMMRRDVPFHDHTAQDWSEMRSDS